MIDTNQITQAGQVVQTVHEQVQANWPFICAVAVLIARELKRLDEWLEAKVEFLIEHGGLFMLVKKLLWNSSAPSAPLRDSSFPGASSRRGAENAEKPEKTL